MRHAFLDNVSAGSCRPGRGHTPLPVSLHRGWQPPPRSSVRARGHRAGSGELKAGEIVPELPLIAGGKSLGGRMTSSAAAGRPTRWRAGTGLSRLSAAPSRTTRHPPGRSPRPRPSAYALPPGNPRQFARADLMTERVPPPRAPGDPAPRWTGRITPSGCPSAPAARQRRYGMAGEHLAQWSRARSWAQRAADELRA